MPDEPETRKSRLKFMRRFFLFVLGCLLLFFLVNLYIVKSTNERVYTDIDDIPYKKFCLVLGSSPYGEACQNRLAAAVELFQAGKVSHFILSGDNSRMDYNEPEEMKKQLISLGIPEEKMTLDYAGFRTLDSVYRAKHVFDVQDVTIVTQEFHVSRAIYLASSCGLQAQAYIARKTLLAAFNENRELGARFLAFVDVVVGREAYFTGPGEPITIK